jgi:hypothetical protein
VQIKTTPENNKLARSNSKEGEIAGGKYNSVRTH